MCPRCGYPLESIGCRNCGYFIPVKKLKDTPKKKEKKPN